MNEQFTKLLLVEDNYGDVRLIQEVITQTRTAQFALVHAERLSDAFQRLQEEHFDVILTDLSLPDSYGLQTLTQLSTQSPETPIIVLTGLDDEALAIKAMQEGTQDYLVKGQIDSNLLIRAIRYAIERHRVRQELQAGEER